MSENVFCLLLSCESQMFVLLPFSQMPPRATGINKVLGRGWWSCSGPAISGIHTLNYYLGQAILF